MQNLDYVKRLSTIDFINTITIDTIANLIAIILGIIIIILLVKRVVDYIKRDK